MSDKQKKEYKEHINTSHTVDETISFADIVLVGASHFKLFILIPGFICTLTIIYAIYFTNPIFTSTSKIMSSSGSSSSSQAVGLAAQLGINLPTTPKQQWVYSEIIKSRTLAKAMLNQTFDTGRFGLQKSLLQILTYGNKTSETGLDTLRSIAIDKFLNMINLSENTLTGIFTLSINAFEPKLAAEINAALINELEVHQKDYNQKKNSETRKFIEERIVDTEKKLMAREESLKEFRVRNRRFEQSPALLLEQGRLSREVSVLTGVFTTLKQQLETAKIEEVKESDYVIIIDLPEIPLSRSKPNKRLMVILAGFFGIGIAALISLFIEFANRLDKEEKEKFVKVRSFIIQNINELFLFNKKTK